MLDQSVQIFYYEHSKQTRASINHVSHLSDISPKDYESLLQNFILF